MGHSAQFLFISQIWKTVLSFVKGCTSSQHMRTLHCCFLFTAIQSYSTTEISLLPPPHRNWKSHSYCLQTLAVKEALPLKPQRKHEACCPECLIPLPIDHAKDRYSWKESVYCWSQGKEARYLRPCTKISWMQPAFYSISKHKQHTEEVL